MEAGAEILEKPDKGCGQEKEDKIGQQGQGETDGHADDKSNHLVARHGRCQKPDGTEGGTQKKCTDVTADHGSPVQFPQEGDRNRIDKGG